MKAVLPPVHPDQAAQHQRGFRQPGIGQEALRQQLVDPGQPEPGVGIEGIEPDGRFEIDPGGIQVGLRASAQLHGIAAGLLQLLQGQQLLSALIELANRLHGIGGSSHAAVGSISQRLPEGVADLLLLLPGLPL